MPADNEDVARRWWAGLSKDGMPPPELYDERIEIGMFEGFPIQGPFQGHEGVRMYVEQTYEVIEDLDVVLDEAIDAEDGETIVTVQRVQGTMRHTRIKADFTFAAVWTIRGGKVLRAQGFSGKAEALEAAGLAH